MVNARSLDQQIINKREARVIHFQDKVSVSREREWVTSEEVVGWRFVGKGSRIGYRRVWRKGRGEKSMLVAGMLFDVFWG